MLIPIIPPEQMKKDEPVSKLGGMHVIPATGVKEFAVKIRRTPTGPKPVIPTGDTCCTKVCTIINNKVKYMEDELLLRKAELASVTEGLLLETREVTRKIPGKLRGQIKEIPGKAEQRISVTYSQSRMKLKKQAFAITNQLAALNDIRYEMLEKGSCKCIEETKFPERETIKMK
jgi:hypothetical protein